MKCKFCLESPDGSNNACLNWSCKSTKCLFADPQNECECFEPERIEYGSSDAYNDEDEFYKNIAKDAVRWYAVASEIRSQERVADIIDMK